MAEVSTEIAAVAQDADWKRKFVSDVFHALSQPLTALHCSLEIALLKPDASAEQYRASIGEAIAMTGRLVETSIFLREMADAEIPGATKREELAPLLRATLEGMAPLLEESGVRLSFEPSEDVAILCDAAKFERALFLIVDQTRNALRAPADLRICCTTEESKVWLCIEFHSEEAMSAGVSMENRNLQLAAATFRAIGGTMTVEQPSPAEARVTVVLPKVPT